VTFTATVVIDAPVERVFAFHERDDALDLLLPKFPPSRVVRRAGGLQPGAVVELQIGPVAWHAVHTAYERNRLFVDEQARGPFRRWVHRHEFEDLGGRTRLTDRVECEFAGGRMTAWAVRLSLHWMFRERHRVTRDFCVGGR
jgi:ligand-binding SRPBCC domain-containing protein